LFIEFQPFRLMHLKVKTRFTFVFEIPPQLLGLRKWSNIPNRLPLFASGYGTVIWRARVSGDFDSERKTDISGRAPCRTETSPWSAASISPEGSKRRRARILGVRFYLRQRRPAIFLGDAHLMSKISPNYLPAIP